MGWSFFCEDEFDRTPRQVITPSVLISAFEIADTSIPLYGEIVLIEVPVFGVDTKKKTHDFI